MTGRVGRLEVVADGVLAVDVVAAGLGEAGVVAPGVLGADGDVAAVGALEAGVLVEARTTTVPCMNGWIRQM